MYRSSTALERDDRHSRLGGVSFIFLHGGRDRKVKVYQQLPQTPSYRLETKLHKMGLFPQVRGRTLYRLMKIVCGASFMMYGVRTNKRPFNPPLSTNYTNSTTPVC
jgi:hypothetical protein